jgi:hypothetical protein
VHVIDKLVEVDVHLIPALASIGPPVVDVPFIIDAHLLDHGCDLEGDNVGVHEESTHQNAPRMCRDIKMLAHIPIRK